MQLSLDFWSGKEETYSCIMSMCIRVAFCPVLLFVFNARYIEL
jgi:hypothetical protein